jgi:16S rRNA (adenine1518-N6/adenine1519-N6)-dimethyltransferase
MTIEEVKRLLQHYNIYPRKEQGQNFLLDDSVITDSIKAAHLTEGDTVLEIGPGFGALTTALSKAVGETGKVIAVEQDRVLAAGLTKQKRLYPNLTIINEDVRTVNLPEAGLEDLSYKLVANLPYSITSWIIRHFLEQQPRPQSLTVLVQKEVAERMAAEPGAMSVLSVATQLYAEPTIIRLVPPESFYPAPKVDSAIIHLERRTAPLSETPEDLMRLVNIGFSSKRKQLHNNLSNGLQISSEDAKRLINKAHLDPTVRPQELTIQNWIELFEQTQ